MSYNYTLMTEHRLTSILNRFTSLTSLILRGLSSLHSNTIFHLLNKSVIAPNLIHLHLFDVCIYPSSLPTSTTTAKTGLNLQNNNSKLKSITISGTIFASYDTMIHTFVSSPNLRNVSLQGCRSLLDVNVQDMLTRLHNLKKLNLCNGSDLIQPMGSSVSLQSLSLSGCIKIKSLQHLHVPNLVELDLSFCPLITDDIMAHLFTSSSSCLEKLMVRGCDGLQNTRINSSKLRVLDISLCGSLKEVELNCDALIDLEIGMCLSLQSFSIDSSSIPSINLSMLPLNRIFLDCASLTHLKLSGCFAMSNDSVECCKCPSLTNLDIRGTDLTGDFFVLMGDGGGSRGGEDEVGTTTTTLGDDSNTAAATTSRRGIQINTKRAKVKNEWQSLCTWEVNFPSNWD
uniref:Uncharacterized protein n=1 Tax=Ditylum brightwellii TaxID=49249 RepID=A0A7S1YTV8_9STRA